jgi:optic atrophy 3 protein
MAVLPLVKLGTLVLRTVCKPIANRLKKEAGYHPKFRSFIISIAQANHRFTTRIQRRIYGKATDVVIRPLNEEKAVQAAADLLGELFVFSVRIVDFTVLSSFVNCHLPVCLYYPVYNSLSLLFVHSYLFSYKGHG